MATRIPAFHLAHPLHFLTIMGAFFFTLDGGTSTAWGEGIETHPATRPLPTQEMGPFAHIGSDTILAMLADGTSHSRDQGKTWSDTQAYFSDGTVNGQKIEVSRERALLRTRAGVLIAGFMNLAERNWTWKNELRDAPGAKLPTYVMRSTDDGQTWTSVQKLHDEWTGAVRDIVQTKNGRVIVTAMKFLHDPGRHSVITYWSDDLGVTWKPSNLLDLGGAGHHGGVTEATITELQDGRLWMLLRTNWGEFWNAYSFDGGKFWRIVESSGIEASSAPAMLQRLASGRLVLLWNRPFPEGSKDWPKTGGDGLWSEVPVSNHRLELSIAFSEDEGETWSPPVVVARDDKNWIAYPYVFEQRPGVLWVTTMQGALRVELQEKDFLPANKAQVGE